jgi:hypothetical protein
LKKAGRQGGPAFLLKAMRHSRNLFFTRSGFTESEAWIPEFIASASLGDASRMTSGIGISANHKRW